jgi:hypothetical protein
MTAETEPGNSRPVLTVAADGSADFAEIADAVAAAPGGAVIRVRPGVYRHPVTIRTDIEVAGDGPVHAVVLELAEDPALDHDNAIPILIGARVGVRGLTVRRAGGTGRSAAIFVAAGTLSLDGCVVEALGDFPLVCRNEGTFALLRRCVFRTGRHGVLFSNGAGGLMERCAVRGAGTFGVSVGEGARATVRHCRIRGQNGGIIARESGNARVEHCRLGGGPNAGLQATDGGTLRADWCAVTNYSYGVLCFNRGAVLLDGCALYGNRTGGVCAARDGDAGAVELARCEVYANGQTEIQVSGQATATIRDCRIHSGRGNGVDVWHAGSRVRLEGCRIADHAKSGVLATDGGDVELIDCDVRDCEAAAISLAGDGAAAVGLVDRCRVSGVRPWGVRATDGAKLTVRDTTVGNGILCAGDVRGGLERCDVTAVGFAAVQIRERAAVALTDSRVHGSPQAGVFVYLDGRAELNRCAVTDNGEAGVEATTGGEATVRNSRIGANLLGAVRLVNGGRARVTGCDLTGNARPSWNVDDLDLLSESENRAD